MKKQKVATLVRLFDISIQRHIKVKGTVLPDDPSLRDYWQHRQTQYGKVSWDKGSKSYQMAQSQNWRCPVCNDLCSTEKCCIPTTVCN